MGAATDRRFFRGVSRQEAFDLFITEVEDARYLKGNGGYTGSIAEHHGLTFPPEVFESQEAAREYITERADKWGPTLAVKVEGPGVEGWMFGGWYSS